MKKAINGLGQVLAVVGGALLFNQFVFLVTSAIGSPTVIAGLGWSLDTPPFNSIVFQGAFLGAGLLICYFVKSSAEDEDGAPVGVVGVRTGKTRSPAPTEPLPDISNGRPEVEPDDGRSAMDRAMEAAIEQHVAAKGSPSEHQPVVKRMRRGDGQGNAFGRRRLA